MTKTVIGRADELVKELGKDKAIEHFQKEIEQYGKPKNFQDVCMISGLETAVDYIKKQYN